MLIVCPQCESRYEIADAQLGGEGRLVRCTRCRTQWHAGPVQPEPTIVAPPAGNDNPAAEAEPMAEVEPEAAVPRMLQGVPGLDMPPGHDLAGAIEHADVETAAARARPGGRRRRERRATGAHLSPSALRTLALVAGVAVVVLALQFRTGVVRAFPASASLFAHVGLPVNLRGLEFGEIRTSAATEGSAPVLVIDGEIRNVTDKPVTVPGLRLSIRDDKGVEIYGWTAALARNSLEPGAVMPFKSRLASPPPEGRAVTVRFARPEDKVAMK
ncbi:zinc-ribbon domain-containing protein [Labrys wisconsinensis]|uniref:Zn finger-like uncharacterized protein n=1 Tax=Labrys wisconsinensis TaxID=425677 RepID=A0ABU0JND8_9HYPH|nr:zinc-ribbon domain-containing protein [Labrys wisconsinensis]MDQ0475155.1 putative Zn finger-like uncharacterized protein [Labrys wisconsinensis]